MLRMELMNVRNYLKQLRNDRKLTQANIAQKMGCYQSYYSEIESGIRQPDMTYSMMEKLAVAFEVPVQTIIEAETAYTAQTKDSA